MNETNKNLFGDCDKIPEVFVFHDESGNFHCGEWVFTGLLWINEVNLKKVNGKIREIREKYGYFGEIHFNRLPKSFNGEFGKKAQVAKDLFNLWKGEISDLSYFNVLAINRTHKKYEHKRFKKDFHAYNRFTAIALKSGLSWFFIDKENIELRIFSDEKTRRPKGILGDGIKYDNFEEYLVSRITEDINEDIKNYKGPKVKLLDEVQLISCPSEGPYTCKQEFLQLLDLLLGAVATAIDPKTKRVTKLWFAEQMRVFIEDIRNEPWKQRYNLHRKFSVSYFPDNDGLIYNNGPLNINKDPNERQPGLF